MVSAIRDPRTGPGNHVEPPPSEANSSSTVLLSKKSSNEPPSEQTVEDPGPAVAVEDPAVAPSGSADAIHANAGASSADAIHANAGVSDDRNAGRPADGSAPPNDDPPGGQHQQPSPYQRSIMASNLEQAVDLALRSPQGLSFAATQCSERAFLLYLQSQTERESAIRVGQKGEHFAHQFLTNYGSNPDDLKPGRSNPLLQPLLWAPECQL